MFRCPRRSLAVRVVLVMFVACLAVTEQARAACTFVAQPTPYKRWTFTTLEWTYSGTLPRSAISGGASSWNPRQSFTLVLEGGFDDIRITDDNTLPSPELGRTVVFDYSSGGSACAFHPDASCPSICYNTSRVYFATVGLSPNNISSEASNWTVAWGVTQDQAVFIITKMVVAHEVGHVFWLADSEAAIDCADASIMNVNESLVCRLEGGATDCDGRNVGMVYSGWTTVGSPCGLCDTAVFCA
jgi:hypothetical protein